MTPNFDELQQKIGYHFQDQNKLLLALTHRSYLNENHAIKESNERCEFLGDAILEYWISKKLYSTFPEYHEGQLTNLRSLVVCTQNLAEASQKFNLGSYLLLSRGEENNGGRQNLSLLADTFESLVGAIHLDGSYADAEKFLETFLNDSFIALSKKQVYKDPKSQFQEIAQAKRGITPHYSTLSESGPDHQKLFEVGLYLNDELIAKGKGNSKQKAEEDAALQGINLLSR